MKQIDNFIKILHEYQRREFENMCAFLDFAETNPAKELLNWNNEVYPNTPKAWRLWFIGLKVWGQEFPGREYELSERESK